MASPWTAAVMAARQTGLLQPPLDSLTRPTDIALSEADRARGPHRNPTVSRLDGPRNVTGGAGKNGGGETPLAHAGCDRHTRARGRLIRMDAR